MKKWFNDLFDEELGEDYEEYYTVKAVVKVEKCYVKRDKSEKNHTKNINRARKAKARRQGR